MILTEKAKDALKNLYFRTCRCIRGKKKRVLFSSFNGSSYSDNPRAVSEAMHALYPEVQLLWLFNAPADKDGIVPDYVTCVDNGNPFAACRALAVADAVVENFSLPKVPKGRQLFVQTWHGDKAFKKILYDSPFAAEDEEVAESVDGYCDLAVAGSAYGERQYRTAFRYRGLVLNEGTPRNDRLVRRDASEIAAVRHTLGVGDDCRIFLYAPTLRRQNCRDKSEQNISALDVAATLDLLEARDGCRWIALMRAHPSVVGLCGVREDARIRNVSDYEDMADLLLVADLLVTDYSSCAGDFALTGRELVLFQADFEVYQKQDRTLYFRMEDSPYYVARSQAELCEILLGMTPDAAAENCRAILEFYGDTESGHAAERVAKYIGERLYQK